MVNKLGNQEKLTALEQFINGVVSAFNEDYGDWMRETNLYWMNLARTLQSAERNAEMSDEKSAAERSVIDARLKELQQIIQYEPSWHPIETSRRVVELALEMRERLGADEHRDASDFGISMTETDPLEKFFFDPERDVCRFDGSVRKEN
jgi:hypothetical protein